MRLFVYRKDKIDVKSYRVGEISESTKLHKYIIFQVHEALYSMYMSVFHIRSIPGEHS